MWPHDVVMDVSSQAHSVDPRKPRRTRRYRVVARANLPTNLIDIVSAAHAAAVAYSSADARALEGHAQSPSEPDKTRHSDSTLRSREEVHHE